MMFARTPQLDKAAAVAAAAAHDWNDDLCIAMSTVTDLLQHTDPTDWRRAELLEMRRALQRMAWVSANLLNYSMKRGARATCATSLATIELFQRTSL